MKIQQTMRRIVQRSASLLVKRTALAVAGFILVSGGIIATQSILGTLPISYAATPPDSCFSFFSGTIYDYYDHEGNNAANPACPLSIEIPANIGGGAVTAIATNAFDGKSLTSVTIPNSVTSIGVNAFSNNQLTSITIPSSVTTILTSAFSTNQLTSISLPSTLTTIGSSAFANNRLTSVTIPDGVTVIPATAFANNQLTSVTLPSSTTTIGNSAFNHNLLANITLPSGVTTIASYAFANNKLTSVTLPNTVTSLEHDAFAYNLIESATLSNSLTSIDDSVFYKNKLSSITLPDSIVNVSDYAFYENELETVTLSNSLETIGENAFSFNRLTSLTIPGSVDTIGASAFWANNLTSLTLREGLTTIGDGVFASNKLETVDLPASVTSIHPNAFTLQTPWGREVDDQSNPSHDLWNGDQTAIQTVYDNVWLVQLYIEGSTSIPHALISEDWFMGEDYNTDGTTANVIGGYIINPASVEIHYRTSTGTDVTSARTLTGTKPNGLPLTNYLASAIASPAIVDLTAPTTEEQQAIDETLSVFFRKGQTISLTAPTITGYQLTSPGSPVNVSLPNTANIFTFTYGLIPEQPTTSTPTPVPEPTPAKRTVTAAPRTSTDGAAPTPTSLEMSRSLVQFADPTGSANGPTDATPADIGELFKSSTVSADESLPCHNISSASLLSPTSFDTPDTNATTLGGVALTVECSEESGKGSASLTFGEEISDIGAIRVYQPIASGRAIDVTDQVTLRSATTDGVTKTILTYPLQDGTTLDTDGAANSSITSKLYLVRLAKSSTTAKDTQQAKAQANAAPTWSPLALAIGGALLVGGLVTAGIAVYRRR